MHVALSSVATPLANVGVAPTVLWSTTQDQLFLQLYRALDVGALFRFRPL